MAALATQHRLPRDVAQCSRGSGGAKGSKLALRHRSTRLPILLITLCCAALSAVGAAVDEPTPEITVPRVTRAPKLVDFLNGTPREAEVKVTDFRQQDPDDGKPVTTPTEAYLSYDQKNLYVAFIIKDDPKLIRARPAKRKQILSDDRITICIDTMHDHRHAFWFDVNPYGVQLDGVTTDGIGDDLTWEGLWYSDARITADGYVVLASIPFRTLRFSDAAKQQWGFAFGRWTQRNNEIAWWPYVTRRKLPRFVGQFGHLNGLENISPGRNLQITPYAMASGSHYLDRPAGLTPSLQTDAIFRGGVDAKVVIKDSLVLDMTVNPDFSQVESDQPQVTVNQRYQVFFPELRPFFMENASYFTAPQQLFYSRNIIDPEFGVRLTGKLGGWGIGVFATDDRAQGRSLAKGATNYGRHASDNVLTLQRDFFTDSQVRLFVTDSEFAASSNRVASLDTRIHLPRDFYVTAQAATSRDQSLAGVRSSGEDYYAALSHSGRNWQYATTYTDISPTFLTVLGYIPRTDIREVKNSLGYRRWREKSVLMDYGPTIVVTRNWNHEGQVRDWAATLQWDMEFKNLTSFQASHTEAFELYATQGFRRRNDNFVFNSEWYKWMALQCTYMRGSAINYYPGAGFAPFLGDSQNATVMLTPRPLSKLRLDETYIFSQLRTRSGMFGESGSIGVYDNHIARSKANYQFNRELSLRVIVDYNAVLPNAALIALDRTKRVGYDILLTYLLHPGTALYAGYTDIYQNYLLDPSRPPNLSLTRFPDMNTGRQVFVKLSYQLRL
jgi:hypothetical protein